MIKCPKCEFANPGYPGECQNCGIPLPRSAPRAIHRQSSHTACSVGTSERSYIHLRILAQALVVLAFLTLGFTALSVIASLLPDAPQTSAGAGAPGDSLMPRFSPPDWRKIAAILGVIVGAAGYVVYRAVADVIQLLVDMEGHLRRLAASVPEPAQPRVPERR